MKKIILLSTIFLSACGFMSFDAPTGFDDSKNVIHSSWESSQIDHATQKDFIRFISNLSYVYLDIARDEHLSFKPNTKTIKSGSIIHNTEEVSGQFVEHRYKVNFNAKNSEYIWVSLPSTVTLKKYNNQKLRMGTKLKLTFKDKRLVTNLSIYFGSGLAYKMALLSGSRNIWNEHHHKEMSNAVQIFTYLKQSDQLYKAPNSWNIKAIENKLK